jgi:mono/diheme cytochrome c family protein
MSKRVLVFAVLALVALVGFSREKQEKKEPPPQVPAELKIPPEDASRANPVKPTESSVAEGKKIFATQCVMCHGESGDGKGDLVEPLKLKLKDWREPESLKGYTDGALFYVLTKGYGQMPGQEGRMKNQQEWHLINYIRSLAPKEPPAKKEEKPS